MENSLRNTMAVNRKFFLDRLMSYIFEPAVLAHKKRVDALLDIQNRNPEFNCNGFYYKGVKFHRHNLDEWLHGTACHPQLIEPLYAEGDKLVATHQKIAEDKIRVDAFLCKSLRLTMTDADVLMILPKNLHKYVETFVKQSEPTLTKEVATEFLEKNETSIQLINSRLLINVLES